MPAARRVLGENNAMTLCFRKMNAMALYEDAGATLNDLREAATTLEDLERTARRVLGGAHPRIREFEAALRAARATLDARETPSRSTRRRSPVSSASKKPGRSCVKRYPWRDAFLGKGIDSRSR